MLVGPFNEQTGDLLESAKSVSIVFENQSVIEVSLSHQKVFDFGELPLKIGYLVGANTKRREYYFDSGQVSIYVLEAPNTVSVTFQIYDYSGQVSSQAFLETSKQLHGKTVLIERKPVSTNMQVMLHMEKYEVYTLTLQSEDVTYSFGTYVAIESGFDTLPVYTWGFPENVRLAYRYLRIGYERQGQDIAINYQDLMDETLSVTCNLYNWTDGSLLYTSTVENQSNIQFVIQGEDYGITNQTSLKAVLEIQHETFGSFNYVLLIHAEAPSATLPFDLSILGDWIIPAWTIFPIVIIFAFASSTSALTSHVGAVLAVIITAILAYIGWVSIPSAIIVLCLALAILYALAMGRRKVEIAI